MDHSYYLDILIYMMKEYSLILLLLEKKLQLVKRNNFLQKEEKQLLLHTKTITSVDRKRFLELGVIWRQNMISVLQRLTLQHPPFLSLLLHLTCDMFLNKYNMFTYHFLYFFKLLFVLISQSFENIFNFLKNHIKLIFLLAKH